MSQKVEDVINEYVTDVTMRNAMQGFVDCVMGMMSPSPDSPGSAIKSMRFIMKTVHENPALTAWTTTVVNYLAEITALADLYHSESRARGADTPHVMGIAGVVFSLMTAVLHILYTEAYKGTVSAEFVGRILAAKG